MKRRLAKRMLALGCKVFVVLALTFGIYLYFGQGHSIANLKGNHYSMLVTNFIDDLGVNGPFGLVRRWFELDPSHIKVTQQEQLVRYKLKILAKSLHNYFSSLSENIGRVINSPTIARFITGQYYGGSKTDRLLKQYLKDNRDVLELSLYTPEGKKLSTARYQNVPEYALDASLLAKLREVDTTLVKGATEGTLIHISKVKQGDEVIGFVTQTLNKVFFTKILDHLEINHKLFYLKNVHDEVIIDNYETYEVIGHQRQSLPYLFYRRLTSLKTQTIPLGVREANYTLGVVLERNNTFGHAIALASLFLFLCLAFLLVNLGWKRVVLLRTELGKRRFYRRKREGKGASWSVGD